MIRVFVGSNDKWADCEPVLEYSIRKHTGTPVEITFMRPASIGMCETGCTSFTNTRFAIPELCNNRGYAIYLDVDMLVLADLAELWQYRTRGKWAILQDGSCEVAVIDCAVKMPPISELEKKKKWEIGFPSVRKIPMQWNCEDPTEIHSDTKLIHFTDLTRQPWDTPERDDAGTRLLAQYQDEFRGS